jgi:hypothetical protein
VFVPHPVAALVDACLLPSCGGERLPGWIARGLAEGLPGVVLHGDVPADLRDSYPDALVGFTPRDSAGSGDAAAAELTAAGANVHLAVRPRAGAGDTGSYVTELQGHGVAAALGPFTGHGALRPFAEGVSAGVMAVAVDPLAALADGCVPEVLRGELGYDGVAVSEPLDAPAVVDRWGIPGAAVLAWIAGLDLLQLGPGCGPGVHQAVHTAAARAVADGDLSAARLAEAADRVARLRRWAGDPGRMNREGYGVRHGW